MDIQIFNNPDFGEVRVTEADGEPMFCLSDVARCLGYSNPAKAIIDHCKGVTILETPTNGGVQQMKYGKESDIYRLIMSSKLPNAEKFQDWVFDEVLPSIRKHGAYFTRDTLERALLSPDYLIELANAMKAEQIKRIEAENKNKILETINKEQAPKAAFTDAVIASKSSILIGELAKIITQNGYPIGQNRLFSWLRLNGYLGTRGNYYNMPNQQYIEQNLFEIKKSVHSENGVMVTTFTPKVTGKGQVYFVNKFLKKDRPLAPRITFSISTNRL